VPGVLFPRVAGSEGEKTMTPYYEHDGIQIFLGDCREVLPSLNDGPMGFVKMSAGRCKPLAFRPDVLITDIPYGISLGVDKDMRGGAHGLAKAAYGEYEDSYENYCSVVVPVIAEIVPKVFRGAVFCGPHFQELPKASALGGVYCRAGSGRHSWGFKTFLPVLFYGTAPNLNKGARPNVIESTATAEPNGHPCPKPLDWMLWLVGLASAPDEVVIDPFAGSGGTLVACKRLGRRAIGIEIEEKYCAIAARRVEAERLTLFEATLGPTQATFETEVHP
jgi:hypothetical protein